MEPTSKPPVACGLVPTNRNGENVNVLPFLGRLLQTKNSIYCQFIPFPIMSNHALHNRYRAPPPSQSSTSAPDPSVEICVDAAITVRMVSGDNRNTARAVARECGIVEDPESHLIPKLKVDNQVQLHPSFCIYFISQVPHIL